MAYLDTSEGYCLASELRTTDELQFTTHLIHDGLLLHLGGSLHAFRHGLFGEALLIDAVNGIADIEEVFDNHHGVLGQERQERHLALLDSSKLGNDLHLFAGVFRQLTVYLEGADGVDVVAKEVDTERQLAAKGIDIEDAATQGKLTWLIDVVDLGETQFTEGLDHRIGIHRIALAQGHGTVVECLLGDDKFSNSLGIGDDER